MVTLALSQMVYFLAVQLPFTGGEDGIQGVPRGMLFGLINTHQWGVWLIWIAAVLTVWSMVYYLQKALPEIRARAR